MEMRLLERGRDEAGGGTGFRENYRRVGKGALEQDAGQAKGRFLQWQDFP